ncbi:MAG: GxxExxY protein [Saprospiraceae bacterium]|nr:GxxExxY protein [Saprospiraceae bacterium]
METNDITLAIRDAAFRIHTALGPGLYESAYEKAMTYELEKNGLKVERQVVVPFVYKGVSIELGYHMDLLVEDQVVVEIKSVDALNEDHFKEIMTYIRLAGKKHGLLINFNVVSLEEKISLQHIVNNYK